MRYSPYLPTADFITQLGPAGFAFDYALDAAQRGVLFWDVMRKRGNQYRAHAEATAPHVLSLRPRSCLMDVRLRSPSTTRWSGSSRPRG